VLGGEARYVCICFYCAFLVATCEFFKRLLCVCLCGEEKLNTTYTRHIHTYTHTYIHTYTHTYIHTYLFESDAMYTCIDFRVYVNLFFACVYVCIFPHVLGMCVCVCVCNVCVCVCVFVHACVFMVSIHYMDVCVYVCARERMRALF
jgi:hypothetical protein